MVREERDDDEGKGKDGKLYFDIQDPNFSQINRVFLINFLNALDRRMRKEKWSVREKILFLCGIGYVLGYNIFSFSTQGFEKDAWIPQDNALNKLIFYPAVFITQTTFIAFLIQILGSEYMWLFFGSREEAALYHSPRSMLRQLPVAGYLLLFTVSCAIPVGFSLYGNFGGDSGYMDVIDNIFALPIYFGFSTLGIQILGGLLLNYAEPLYTKIISFLFVRKNPEFVQFQIAKLMIKYVKASFITTLKIALENYRKDPDRSTTYKNILSDFESLSQLTPSIEEDFNLPLDLLTSFVEMKEIDFEHYDSFSFKKLLIRIVTLMQIGTFLYFAQIGTSEILQNNFIPFTHSKFYGFLDVIYKLAESLGFTVFTVINAFLFKKTLSLFLNEIPGFLQSLFHRLNSSSLLIQYHPYAFALGASLITSIVVLSLPSNTEHTFHDWVLGGYNHGFNFDQVQYSGEEAAETFYPAALLTFFYFMYPSWRWMKAGFHYLMMNFTNWFEKFSNNEDQRREIQFEKYIKIAIRILKSSNPDSILQICGGMTEKQLLVFFKDFHKSLDRICKHYGINSARDLFIMTETVLQKVENDEENILREVKNSPSKQNTSETNLLSIKQNIGLLLKIQQREREAKKRRRVSSEEEQESLEEKAPLLHKSSSWVCFSQKSRCVVC